MKNTGEIIRIARTKIGMSQSKLAKITGLTQATISSIESGKRTGGLATLLEIAKALNMTIEKLTGNDGNVLNEQPSTYSAKKKEAYVDFIIYSWRTASTEHKKIIEKDIAKLFGEDRAKGLLEIAKESE